MTTLTDRLRDLAEDAPGAVGPSADEDLWLHGRRLQRRRRAVTASMVAVVVLAIGSLTTLVVDARSYAVPVAAAEAPLGLPDRLYQPSEWTPTTDETGPIGPLVAVAGGYRRTTWDDPAFAVAGVSASGGYAFLDLPGLADTSGELPGPDAPVRLSRDGRWVAYYLTGPTIGEPYRGAGDPIVGVALYDTVTGAVRRETVPTEHGWSIDQELTWVGDSLLVGYGQITTFAVEPDGTGGSVDSTGGGVLAWDAVTGTVEQTPSTDRFPWFDYLAAPAGDDLVVRQRRSYALMAPDGSTEVVGRLDVPHDSAVFLNPSRTLAATTEDRDGRSVSGETTSPIVVAAVAGPGAGETSRLDDGLVGAVVGWRDDTHLVVSVNVDREQLTRYLSVDVETGARADLLDLPLVATEMQTQIATQALSGPVLAAPEPDFPGDPRRPLVVGGALAVLLAGAGLWRHRVRL